MRLIDAALIKLMMRLLIEFILSLINDYDHDEIIDQIPENRGRQDGADD